MLAPLPLACHSARAQSSFPGADEWAEAIVEQSTPKWKGPVVPAPAPRERPAAATMARSTFHPLAVHAEAGVGPRRIHNALAALERAQATLDAAGWPAPYPDGGRGATSGFDLYLVRRGAPAATAFRDAPIPWLALDAASTFAVMDPQVPDDTLAACVTAAYAEAVLLGQDPAEARAWRRATGAWLAYLVTGQFGCDDAVTIQQREPWRSWIAGGARHGAGGGLLLALLSEIHDGGSGTFIREVWQLTRQLSGLDAHTYRGSPDLWMALERAVSRSEDDLRAELANLGVARFFAGVPERETAASYDVLRALGPRAAPPVSDTVAWGQLPEHFPPADPPLEPFGSRYYMVDVSDAPPSSQLRVWLRGEYGVEWSLVAVRLDDEGKELRRLLAPGRREPRSYLPVELFSDTDRVLLVVTNLSSRLPDADIPDENVRSFRLIVDQGPGDDDPGHRKASGDEPSDPSSSGRNPGDPPRSGER